MTILITGFSGSLGTAFTNYLLNAGHTVIGVDNNEWATAAFPDEPKLEKHVGDFTETIYPYAEVIIHCAAYKHVNLGETNPQAFIDTNVTKYQELLISRPRPYARVLFISTDKSVEPISLYGYTKAIGEKLTWNAHTHDIRGNSVARLGNILNSNGSVIPLWEKQIANNEPITITDERCVRYVIEVEDAVNQIWSGFMTGDKLIIPSMEKQRIMDILSEVLKRHGYEHPDAYEPGVVITGLRPGEKLEEKLRWSYEDVPNP